MPFAASFLVESHAGSWHPSHLLIDCLEVKSAGVSRILLDVNFEDKKNSGTLKQARSDTYSMGKKVLFVSTSADALGGDPTGLW